MANEFRLPELGENIKSGDLVKVLISPGDTVTRDQAVLELETDKATIEVPSAVSGKVKEIFVKDGDKLNVGQLIFTVDGEGGASQGEAPKAATQPEREDSKTAAARAEKSAAAKTQASVTQSESVLAEPAKAHTLPSAKPQAADSKAVPEEGDEAPPEGNAQTAPDSSAPADVIPFPHPGVEAGAHAVVPAAPSVRRVAREIGVDINQVQGSGPNGRISVDDVKRYTRDILTGGVAARSSASPLPDFARWGEVERKAMTQIRRKTAEHMAQAWANVSQVTQHDKADITNLEEIRKRYSGRVEKAGGRLTMTAIALKVAAAALRVFPQFAASIDMARGEIIYKKFCHISVAVDTDRGLLVPVLRDVDRKNIIELSVELSDLAEKARSKKLSLEEMEGGVFTITNLGGIGGTYFTPIVNYPEVAILGISRSQTEPAFTNGQFEPRLMLPLSLSYDHRLIDGADAARFLRWIAEALEQPFLLPLQG